MKKRTSNKIKGGSSTNNSETTKFFHNIGIPTIGDLAHYPIRYLTKRFGLRGEVYHHLAWGRDPSPVCPDSLSTIKGIGHSVTLPRDYRHSGDIEIVLLELTDEVCHRARKNQKAGRTVSVSVRSYDLTRGFHRQRTLPAPSNLSVQVYDQVQVLFRRHWDGRPVRSLSVTLTNLVDNASLQQTLFLDTDRLDRLSRTVDNLHQRFGETSILRASSLTPPWLARDRATKMGGHEA